jgi:chromosome partitioning protein
MVLHFLLDEATVCGTAKSARATEQKEAVTCKRCLGVMQGTGNGGRPKLDLVYLTLKVGFFPEDLEWLKSCSEPMSLIVREAISIHRQRLKSTKKKIMPKNRKIITITSNSGGSGKSTTCKNLAYEFAAIGRKVLVIDLDPQASLDLFFGFIGVDTDAYSTQLFEERFNGKCSPSNFPIDDGGLLHLFRGSSELAKTQINLSGRRSRERCLAKALKLLSEYDIVLIDCPATNGLLIENALAAATHVLIPISPEEKSIHGLGDLLAELQSLGTDLEITPPSLLGVVLSTRANSTTLTSRSAIEDLNQLSKNLGFQILPGIDEYEDIRKANGAGLPLRQFRPRHPGVTQYQTLANHIQSLLEI